ncbi:hypothetical protein [[Clostridium] symbiosum]|uniref:hypothetical protein n=1 Tax=Clostridium symbiosum TaxID=1512 RepID=UPI001A9A6EE6|nr:hypothetical protein [[Clostridium] symbiosum]
MSITQEEDGCNVSGGTVDGDLVKQVRTPPVRLADGVVRGVYESFVLGQDCRGLGLRAKIKSAEHTPAL